MKYRLPLSHLRAAHPHLKWVDVDDEDNIEDDDNEAHCDNGNNGDNPAVFKRPAHQLE